VIGSPDAPASKRFFTEGIGFRVSDEVPAIGASFMRCSTDHHNLLVQPGPVSFLHHTAWEMDDVDAVDSVGAGDAFCAAFALALAEGRPPASAVRFASAAGAISATRPGAAASLPFRAEVEALLARGA